MQRDLLDALRCPCPHEEQWLVALVHAVSGADIRSADLACPRCDAVFPVREGVADFRRSPTPAPRATRPSLDAPVDAHRLAALLGVGVVLPSTGGFPLLLAGTEAGAGPGLASLGAGPQLWVNPPEEARCPPDGSCWGVLQLDERLPLGRGTLAAVALDAGHARRAPLVSAVALALRPGGRLVAPADTPVPSEIAVLARDAAHWVGEAVTPPGGLVTLRRQSPPA